MIAYCEIRTGMVIGIGTTAARAFADARREAQQGNFSIDPDDYETVAYDPRHTEPRLCGGIVVLLPKE